LILSLKGLTWVAVLSVLCVVIAYSIAADVARCYLVRWSTLNMISPNVYVDPTMDQAQRNKLMDLIIEADGRISGLYGSRLSNPVIIAGNTMDVMVDYGGDIGNQYGRTRILPFSTYIILGPRGIRDLDVLSHEIAHAEFAARVGYRYLESVPSWFDEGLAMQFDERVSETAWYEWTGGRKELPDLDRLSNIQHDDWLGYAAAKYIVNRWLAAVGQPGLLNFMDEIRNGAGFDSWLSQYEAEFH
ncbi:hypothetical protein ACFLZW_06680, partial [Chloroflexota bacterium]